MTATTNRILAFVLTSFLASGWAFGATLAPATARAAEAGDPVAAAAAAEDPAPDPAVQGDAPDPAADAAEPKAARDDLTHYWLLEEFDWGDDEEVVAESVLFDPHFECKSTHIQRCVLVSTVIDRERLLARFHHHQGELWQVVVLTPDLNQVQAGQHLRRVWQIMVDYVTRMRGEPMIAAPLPELTSLEFGPPQLTHFWSLDDLEVRVRVGRRDEDLFYVGVYFSDPVRGEEAREAHDAKVAEADEKQRMRRAARARGESLRKRGTPRP